jgi:hypothetical protein
MRMLTSDDVRMAKERLHSVIQDCIPYDAHDARHDRLTEAIDFLIQIHLCLALQNRNATP